MDINSPSLSLSLPLLPETKNWSAEIQAAYENIQHTYDHAIRVLRADGAEPTRIAFHVDAISSNALPILEALTPDADNTDSDEMSESLPVKWLADVAMVLGCVVSGLEHLGTTANEEEEHRVDIPELTGIENTGKRGRPKKIIDLDFLIEATSAQHHIRHVELAKIVDVHPATLRRYMRQHSIERCYSNLRDRDLDALVKIFKCRRPESGFRYLVGFLRQQGVRVQH
ncbi:hypothetical protein DFJ58DRAFT_796677, partial [Suillus subalutaceus]|uniref:uncharacterized protein n=1 Tax=Suillus subalutaceus TaxID=48586 RepID=UPI001B86CB6A